MTEFAQASELWQGIQGLFGILAFLLYVYNAICCVRLKRYLQAVPAAALVLVSFAFTQIMIMNSCWSPHYPAGIHLKTVPAAVFCLLLIAGAALQQHRIARWNRSHISAMSVKEAFDSLPAGLCYYLPGGLIKLVNLRMNDICSEACGAQLMDPEGFWQDLTDGSLPASLRGGDAPMLRFEDGRVFRFVHRVLDTELGPVHELLSTDVSRDYALNRELEQKQEKAREINARLKALLGSIEYLTMSRELLQLKAQLHDELGKSLLLSRRYLLESGSIEASAVQGAWLRDLRLLGSSGQESWQAPYFILKEQAQALGMDLEIRGDLPMENALIPVVETALSVHMTNVLRHAGGRRAFVSCSREGSGWRVILTNDGRAPAGPIREGGGLSTLRSQVEALGGKLDIEASPAFRMSLHLPCAEGEIR